MSYSIIQKSQLEGAHRLDAEYYQPEFLDAMKKLSKASTIAELTSDVRYGLYLEPNYLERGVDFIRAMNLFDYDISGEILKIDGAKVPLEYKLEAGDCLITRSGANTGAASVIYPRLRGATFGSYTIRVRFNKINPFFAGLFLNTKYGIFQTLRLQTGMAQPNLNIPNIEQIKIPIFIENEQKKIEQICLEIQNQKENAKKFYAQAEQLLLHELGLENFSAKGGSPPSPGFGRAGASGGETENELYTVVNFSDVKSAERMDAEFFGGRCEKVMKKCRAHSPEKLGEIATLKKGIEPGSEAYREGGKLFVRVSNLSKEGLTDNNQQFLSEKMYDEFKKDYQPKLGEILLSKDATPGIAYVVKEPIDGVTSGGIVKVKLKEQIDPEYVALCINSIVGQSQVERDAGGSIIKHWKPEQIKNLLIPILPVATQKKIADLVRESHAARKKAKELLEEAKRKVEEMIENF